MGPKRKKSDQNGVKQEKNPEIDHELFLQAFEKPTQIYRYLRTRSIVLPSFLPRTLTYMKQRRSVTVTNAKRKNFKVDSLLGSVESRLEKRLGKRSKPESLKVAFEGFHIAEFATEAEYADVEILLYRICQKKRKEASLPIVPSTLAKLRVPVNPKPSTLQREEQTLEVPSEVFAFRNGHVVRTHVLMFKVQCATLKEASGAGVNGEGLSPSEPPIKRRRNGRISSLEEEVLTFRRELVVFDKNRRCLLTPGEYELGVESSDGSEKIKLNTVWESFNGKNVRPLELFSDYPTLKFNLSWNDKDSGNGSKGSDDPSEDPNSPSRVPPSGSDGREGSSDFSTAFESWLRNEYTSPKPKENGLDTPRKRMRVFYQFSHNNSTQQETEARSDLRCPWCCLACHELYSLLKHLRLCHARFNFLYIPHPKGARIDVSINNRYDGSYVGNPQDIHSHVGYAFSRSDPVRRTPVTHVMVYRPRRPPPTLSEFQDTESDTGGQLHRQLVQGHNRLYFHSMTCSPVRPQELDHEGHEETHPPWLKEKTVMMIEEFSDVNEGEKELMKLWNVHVMEKEYIGDCMVPQACHTFVEEKGRRVIEKNLSRNFLLHLINLNDFGLIRPEIVHKTFASLEHKRLQMSQQDQKS